MEVLIESDAVDFLLDLLMLMGCAFQELFNLPRIQSVEEEQPEE